ncbi:hypothetical protein [Cellulomonas sp. ATA003]|uniref:hypothetical protein n=1 Tax=Cellulomonas sp. ATA003 TaxID=3073064 RepID=UPI002873D85E|nr:hypothetical protein [Cellulomonas sp. ATA003]WNB86201.1 hypothetical protein REH70_02725 [Cellulomonas sp. ATA003]
MRTTAVEPSAPKAVNTANAPTSAGAHSGATSASSGQDVVTSVAKTSTTTGRHATVSSTFVMRVT